MPLKKFFLSHYNRNADEVQVLAEALRLHGIVPWVDKDGGFHVGDHSAAEARRAIHEDCFGLLFYATRPAFTRKFIRDVEIDEALQIKQSDPAFVLVAVPRRLTFQSLSDLSQKHFGQDLSLFHTLPVSGRTDLRHACDRVAVGVLEDVLCRTAGTGPLSSLSIQYSTRDLMPDAPDDVLRIDATSLLRHAVNASADWARLLEALQAIKRQVSRICGRPRIIVNGSKHLTAAFLFGRVFAPFQLQIRQTPDAFWATDALPTPTKLLTATQTAGLPGERRLFVEVASRYKDIAAGVDTLLAQGAPRASLRLSLRPVTVPLDVNSASMCCALADQAYTEIDKAVQLDQSKEIHLFAAAPQAFMMMLARKFQGMPPVHLYEWTSTGYVLSAVVSAGVL
jgi:hypothetical protein